jgi:hypothetical protein
MEGWFVCELISHAGFVGSGWKYFILQSAMHVKISSQIYLKGTYVELMSGLKTLQSLLN